MVINLNTLKIDRLCCLIDLDNGLFEPYVLKGTRTVLLRVRGSNVSILSDKGIRWVLRRGKESNLLVLSDFSYENYKIGINKYKIIPVIFPKEIFNINKFQDQMSYSLMEKSYFVLRR